MQLSLTGRLLCAAQQTYRINTSGTVPASPLTPAPPPSSLVGWKEPPQCCVSGDDGISAVMVGETGDETNGEVIVAYRGTEPFDSLDHERMLLDWIDDFMVPLVNAPNIPGSVHYGYSHGVNELWSWLEGQLKTLPTTKKPLYVTGHSKGGGMANIAAVKLVAADYTPYVCTFEAARCGDPAFADGFNAQVKHATRYEYQDDIVPFLPPSDAFLLLAKQLPFLADVLSSVIPSYVPVGDLRYINWQNQIVGDSPALEAQRIAHLMDQLSSLNCGHVIDDHAIGPGSGAAAVICGPIWGPPRAPPGAAAAPAPTTDVPF
jgi:hypothetical protein